jgi:hypothetical protein
LDDDIGDIVDELEKLVRMEENARVWRSARQNLRRLRGTRERLSSDRGFGEDF